MKKDNEKEEKHYAITGTYIGVICGAIVMMIAGGSGHQTAADLSLIMGLCAGPSIGWFLGYWKQKKHNNRRQQDEKYEGR